MFIMAVRFIPTVTEEVMTVIDAQWAREFGLERGNLLRRAKNYVPIVVNSF